MGAYTKCRLEVTDKEITNKFLVSRHKRAPGTFLLGMEAYNLRQEIACQARTIKSYCNQISVLEEQKMELAYENQVDRGQTKASLFPSPLSFFLLSGCMGGAD